MIEKIKNSLIVKNHELKARVNTLELENEMLKDKRITELFAELNKESKCEKLEQENAILKLKNQQLKEVIKELTNGKTHK